VRNGVGERPDDGGAGGDGFRVGISTFVRLTSISSGPGLSGRFMVVLPVLGGEARERVDDTEPRWLCDRIEGDGEMGLPARWKAHWGKLTPARVRDTKPNPSKHLQPPRRNLHRQHE
jgi:hypothetical protein